MPRLANHLQLAREFLQQIGGFETNIAWKGGGGPNLDVLQLWRGWLVG